MTAWGRKYEGVRMRIAGVVACLTVLSTCSPEGHREALPDLEHEEHAASEHAPEAFAYVVENLLGDLRSAPVVGITGPGGEVFRVVSRSSDVGHYPCTSCHIRPIGTKDAALAQMHAQSPEFDAGTAVDCAACHDPSSPDGLQLDCTECHERDGTRDLMPSRTAHLTIRLGHPSGHYRNCLTCHAAENPGTLVLQDGGRATLDEAYRLCAGCHFMQAEDWAGGAHGKRLGGWQGERVILSCTGCHDPHSPRFPVRRPVTFPKLARREAVR